LKNFGAKKVVAFATHGLFSGNAFEKIKASSVDKIITTNTIPNKGKEQCADKIITLSVGEDFLY
jgi:ribose-phosphate pyrophosphokinase